MSVGAFVVAALVSIGGTWVAAASVHAEAEARAIKALAPSEVADLLAGRGMGLARAAELNGYPGPMHVLELASELRLSASQETKTRELFARMRASAKELGAQLVAAEQALDAQFASRQVDPRSLVEALDRVASLQAKVRGVHLLAHLEQTGLLTSEQVALYAKLRGSSVGAGDPGGHGGHGHRSR